MSNELKNTIVKKLKDTLKTVKGIVDFAILSKEDLQKVLKLEEEAEKKAVMGITRCFNKGLREVMNRDMIISVANNNEFRHASEPTIYWVVADTIIGQEVPAKCDTEQLKKDQNLIFIGQNFVLYKDVLKQARSKDAIFIFPGLKFPELEVISEIKDIISASPSGPSDIYIKKKVNWSLKDPTLGTILIGFNLITEPETDFARAL